MTARTRSTTLCLEAAERDMRALTMGNQLGGMIDGILTAAATTDNAQWFERNAAAIAEIRAARIAEGWK